MYVTVAAIPPLELRGRLERRDYQAALVELALPGNPDPYPLWHQTQIATGQNYAGLDHRRISEVIETARITVDPTRQAALYREFQELFADEVPAILLYQLVYTYGVGRKVSGRSNRPADNALRPSGDHLLLVHRYPAEHRQPGRSGVLLIGSSRKRQMNPQSPIRILGIAGSLREKSYNYASPIPGVLKNALDWASRPPETSPFSRLPQRARHWQKPLARFRSYRSARMDPSGSATTFR